MKTLKLILGIFVVLGATSHLNAQFVKDINVNFGGDALNSTAWSSTVAPLDYAGNVWNAGPSGPSAGAGISNLAWSDSTLGNSGIGYTAAAANGNPLYTSLATGSSLSILQSFQYDQVASTTLTFTGLDATKSYDLVFAFYQTSGRDQNFTLSGVTSGGGTQELTGASGTSFASGVNYVEFTNVITSSGDATLTFGPAGDDGNSYSLLSGFQIAQVPSEIPEPKSMALIGLGALALLFVRRRLVAA